MRVNFNIVIKANEARLEVSAEVVLSVLASKLGDGWAQRAETWWVGRGHVPEGSYEGIFQIRQGGVAKWPPKWVVEVGRSVLAYRLGDGWAQRAEPWSVKACPHGGALSGGHCPVSAGRQQH